MWQSLQSLCLCGLRLRGGWVGLGGGVAYKKLCNTWNTEEKCFIHQDQYQLQNKVKVKWLELFKHTTSSNKISPIQTHPVVIKSPLPLQTHTSMNSWTRKKNLLKPCLETVYEKFPPIWRVLQINYNINFIGTLCHYNKQQWNCLQDEAGKSYPIKDNNNYYLHRYF